MRKKTITVLAMGFLAVFLVAISFSFGTTSAKPKRNQVSEKASLPQPRSKPRPANPPVLSQTGSSPVAAPERTSPSKSKALLATRTKPSTFRQDNVNNQDLSLRRLKPAIGFTREVVGYYAEDWIGDTASMNSVNSYGNKMAGIAAFSFRLKSNGTLAGTAPSQAVKKTRSSGGRALALVHNYVNGSFDRDMVHKILVNPTLRGKTESSILYVIKNGGFDGVNIDFENVLPSDRELFNLFIKELIKLLHKEGYLVTVSVPAKTYDATTGWGGAFDYKTLGKTVDRVMLMTYDEHWFGGTPGPVASVGWVEEVVRYAVSQLPSRKILLGLGMYGYDWSAGKSVKSLPASKAIQEALRYGAVINWDSRAQVPYFYYWPNGVKRVVWFESNNSAAFKMNLVNRFNLAGVAIWRLGFEDAGFWRTISSKFGAAQ